MIRPMKNRSARTALALVLAAPLTAVTMTLAGASPASAALTDCSGDVPHSNRYVSDPFLLKADSPVRSGPSTGCTVRFRPEGRVDIHCFVYRQDSGQFWWFVDTSFSEGTTGRQGWVREDNFVSPPTKVPAGNCLA